MLLTAPLVPVRAQQLSQPPPLAKLSADKRVSRFWQYCLLEQISEKDSLEVHRFFDHTLSLADSLDDHRLKSYVQYSRRCWRIIFSADYKKHFAPGDYQTPVRLFSDARDWATGQKLPEIAASCEYYAGQVYYMSNRYGLAFEHLLKADEAFGKIGYAHVLNASEYLYSLGLRFYQFEEYEKALDRFLQATNYEFYLPRVEVNTLNAIGLIYARMQMREKALIFFRRTIAKATQRNDLPWIGIGSGNLGNVFLAEHKDDSALVYHQRNFAINTAPGGAQEDAAKSALSLATLHLHKHQADSALFYANTGKQLADLYIVDTAESLDFHRRLFKVMIDYYKETENYHKALLLTDSLSMAEQEIRSTLDNKILSRAIEKTDAVSYDSRLTLLKSEKNLEQLRLFFVITVLVVILFLSVFVLRNRWLREKRHMLLAEKDKQILVAEKLRAEDGLRHSRELLTAYIDTIKEKTTLIGQLESELMDLKRSASHSPELETLTASAREKLLSSTILTDQEWHQFKSWFEQVYPGFSYRLKETYPRLSPAEARFFYLMKLNLSSREMAAMLGISVEAIHKLRYRLRKKLQLDEESSFDTVISKIS